jgi:hypothetical protein
MRKARLNPAYAELYPDLQPDVCVRASVVAATVMRRFRSMYGADGKLPGRVLSEAHFIFSGGGARTCRWGGLPSRATDG